MPLAAEALLEELRELAAEHFTRKAIMVSTDRRGRFEAGWARHSSDRPYIVLGHRSGMPLHLKQRQTERMATLIRNYAKHPQADQERIVRTHGWPDAFEITLT
jgi:hypothetical protein